MPCVDISALNSMKDWPRAKPRAGAKPVTTSSVSPASASRSQ
jgi:hypothetical protein